MSWVKVDSRFPTHVKTLDIGPLAEALWLRGLCYAGEHLSDGFVPSAYVRRMHDLDGPGEAEKLVEAGLWEMTSGGWVIHDYLEYQRSREDAEDLSIKRAEAGRRGGKQRASKLLEANASKPKQTGEANFKQIREEERREEKINGNRARDDELTTINPLASSWLPLLTDRFKDIENDFRGLSPEFTSGMFQGMLLDAEAKVGPVSRSQLAKGLKAAHSAIERVLAAEKSGGKPISNLRPYTASIIATKVQEAVR